MIRKSVVGRVAATALLSAALSCMSITAMAAKGAIPGGKPFQVIQGQFDDVQSKIGAIESSIADLQMQIDDLVSDTTSLKDRIAINEHIITTLQADNLDIKDQLMELAMKAEEQGIAIDTNSVEIQELLLSSILNYKKIQHLEGKIDQLEDILEDKQDNLYLQCPEGMALTALQPDGSIECEEFITQAGFGTISERTVKKVTFDLPPSVTKYWCPTTNKHHSYDEIWQLGTANTLLCWASAAMSTSLLHWNPYNGSLNFGAIEKTTPEHEKDIMCSDDEIAVWGGGTVPDAEYASIRAVEPYTDEKTGQSGFRVTAQRRPPPYPTFCGPIMDASVFGMPLPNLLVDQKYCENTNISVSVLCLK